ncbi:GNAT family N-acetyltransferase [Agromyces sp. MMS24-K17]|uniref:GNAT family N-acetyltransferase n=1 Tax=Agromyces sp. MMS24-K17 TaxID=3372850 RepID=UPI003754B385
MTTPRPDAAPASASNSAGRSDRFAETEVDGSAFVLRRARRADLDRIVELIEHDPLRAAELRAAGSNRPAIEQAFERIDADPAQCYCVVAGPDGTVVGCMQLTFIPGLSRGGATRMQVEAVRIAEELRGSGLGSWMIRWAVDHARAEGARLVQLTSDARRTDARRFYERLGFEASHVGFKLAL